MNILAPPWKPKIQLRDRYSVDWSHPITNAMSYVNVTNNLMQAPTYSKFGYGTYSNVGVSLALDTGGVGIKGTDVSSKLKWTGRGPKANATAGTVLVYTNIAAISGNNFLFRLDDGTEANSLFLFAANINTLNYGWWLGGGTQSYKQAINPAPIGKPFIIGLTWDTASPFEDCWCDGKVIRNTTAFNTADTSNYNLNIGNSNTTNLSWLNNVNNRIYWIAFWDRVLSNSEIVYLNANPMCFLIPPETEMPMLFISAPSVLYGHNIGASFTRKVTTIGY